MSSSKSLACWICDLAPHMALSSDGYVILFFAILIIKVLKISPLQYVIWGQNFQKLIILLYYYYLMLHLL